MMGETGAIDVDTRPLSCAPSWRRAVLAALLVLGASGASAFAGDAEPRSYLFISGNAGNSYTNGAARTFTRGTWTANAYDRDGDGPVDMLILTFQGDEGETRTDWSMWFASSEPGRPLEPGFYPNANGAEGYPWLFVGGEGFGDHGVGSFTVLDADFDTSGGTIVVRSFSARFESAVGGGIYGAVSYQAPARPYVTSATYSRPKGALTVSGERLQGTTALEVDGAVVPAKANRAGVVKAKGVVLGTGEHEIVAIAADGARTPPLVVDFDLGLPGPPPERSSIVIESVSGDAPSLELRNTRLSPIVFDSDGDGDIEVFHLFFADPDYPANISWEIFFSTYSFGRDLLPGEYPRAGRNVDDGFDAQYFMGNNNYSCNFSTGKFTVLDVVVDSTQGYPKLLKFAATFEQECFEGGPTQRGSIVYYGPTRPVIARASYSRDARKLTVNGLYFSPNAKVVVDGRELSPASVSTKSLTVEGVDLRAGIHSVYVKNRDGLVTQPFVVSE